MFSDTFPGALITQQHEIRQVGMEYFIFKQNRHWCLGHIRQVDRQHNAVLVHFAGWPSTHDEWIGCHEPRFKFKAFTYTDLFGSNEVHDGFDSIG